MDIIGYITEPFQYGFMVRALVVLVVVSVTCPIVGLFVITRGYGFMGDALAHSVFPGMVAAIIAGLSPWFGAVPLAIGFAIAVGYLVRRTGFRSDAAIAILFAWLFALGIVMISLFSSRVSVDLEGLLIGQVLAASWGDIVATLVTASITVVIVAGFYKEMVFVSFDSVGAEVSGVRTEFIEYLLLATIAIVVVITVQAVGVILVLALLVSPSATAMLLVRRHTHVIVLGMFVALLASVLGLYVSYYVNLPTGAVIALLSGGMFGVVALARGRVL